MRENAAGLQILRSVLLFCVGEYFAQIAMRFWNLSFGNFLLNLRHPPAPQDLQSCGACCFFVWENILHRLPCVFGTCLLEISYLIFVIRPLIGGNPAPQDLQSCGKSHH